MQRSRNFHQPNQIVDGPMVDLVEDGFKVVHQFDSKGIEESSFQACKMSAKVAGAEPRSRANRRPHPSVSLTLRMLHIYAKISSITDPVGTNPNGLPCRSINSVVGAIPSK